MQLRASNSGLMLLASLVGPGAGGVSQPTDHATENEDGPASGDVPAARPLVAGQFVLTGILVLVPGRHDRPVAAALKVACTSAPSLARP
jgi:hypothetical protein